MRVNTIKTRDAGLRDTGSVSQVTSDKIYIMEEKEIKEEEILDEDIVETTEDVDSLLKSAPQKFNMKDEDQEDNLVNKQDDGEEFKATWPLHDDMKKTQTNDFHRGCRIKADKYEFASR